MMKIGLTYTGTEWKHENYVRWIRGGTRAGGGVKEITPIEIIRLSMIDDNLEELQYCDGLVLSGGVDIHPEFYGGSLEYPKTPQQGWERGRDGFEQEALQWAWRRGLPVLGVCRGLQLINVTLGGTLVQDLGVGDDIHEGIMGVDKCHEVMVRRDTLLAEVLGRVSGMANSAHHQAVDGLGAGLRVNCQAVDGTIEGLEWEEPEGKSFMLAVQWHPERMYADELEDDFLYRLIRNRFIEEIEKLIYSKHADH
jgi:putative glutamine amidotransferase